jgi:hypothetical protein
LLALRDHLNRTCPGATAETSQVVNVYKVTYPVLSAASIFCLILQNGSTAQAGYIAGHEAAVRLGFDPKSSSTGLEIATTLEESHFVLIARDCVARAEAIESMARLCTRTDVGAVCCKIKTPTGDTKSAGAKYQFQNPDKPPLIKMFRGLDQHNNGYEDRIIKNHDVSVATDAILIKSPIFALIEGFSGDFGSVDYKIADMALEIGRHGYKVVYDADAVFTLPNIDLPRTSIKEPNPKIDEFTFIKKWKDRLPAVDPADNPQFDCTSPYCALKEAHFAKASIGRILRKVKGLR